MHSNLEYFNIYRQRENLNEIFFLRKVIVSPSIYYYVPTCKDVEYNNERHLYNLSFIEVK